MDTTQETPIDRPLRSRAERAEELRLQGVRYEPEGRAILDREYPLDRLKAERGGEP